MLTETKRKREPSSNANGPLPDYTITVVPTSDFPPILALSHGISMPPTTQFTPYVHVVNPPAKKPRKAEEFLLYGETPQIGYEGREMPEDGEHRRHYVGIFNPETNEIELHLAPKLHFSRMIKAHIKRDRLVDGKGVVMGNMDSRTALGKEFGTKKSQKRLRELELNKIDVSDMNKNITTSIVSQVEANTKDMPTAAELGHQVRENKPIPKVNHDAKHPNEVYKLEDIISSDEYNVLWVREWERGEELRSKSSFVQARIRKLSEDKSKKHTRLLKILRYISFMIDFHLLQQRSRGRLPAMDRVKKILSVDHAIAEGFFRRYTEKTISGGGGSDKDIYAVSPALANKILYHMAVLCLMVDQYDVDIFELKNDLGLQPKELTLAFKEVGCLIREFTKPQYTAMKMTKAEAAQHKRAVLKIPLEFPKPPTRRAKATGR
ncbi:RNA polymerase I associated factor, A49-like protein [Tuber magnatum]|uniref:RNA polymerase I associated factor, A49-like protein n=1 Tax=Tuber magnatum TaxID=42249 RepID=A0A317SUP7_9PEZI|nr:RNA polymerase I associated factor, A49-like protein [Tuber magnatum]